MATDQHFFVQDSASYPVIFGEPYITPTWIKTKLLNNGSAYAEVKLQDGEMSVKILTVRQNHERNRNSQMETPLGFLERKCSGHLKSLRKLDPPAVGVTWNVFKGKGRGFNIQRMY